MRLNIVITYERLTLNSKLKIFELETRISSNSKSLKWYSF